ncbi:COP1-interacting protein 7 isoform X2 [Lotus japonicus]|uniref:COP1-interacting protein 7 isoform X2 n=1 Tax=Lotus japonicus TaxID=34305 RepID=UPI00258F9EBA|nr:COP1-interacting protein 7 isoform X2 [Lotus japonicus]
MEPNSRLDHALFQLTPTRTRCDLIIVAGGVNERLASGILEPFLSHLKSAKDQISKGGYSITLHPPVAHAPWFTKATLLRFVRFVSTPEVLERFVTIEKEIVQIEDSIQSSEKGNLVAETEGNVSSADGRIKRSTTSKLKDELSGTNQEGYEENSRVRLQRVLDNRKAMLCKEQAMAYARALVAGYYPESLDDLICFADAFGASRLRQACVNFLELCKQKNEDKRWIDEIAAMQAFSHPELPYLRTSGIILDGEDDPSNKLNGDGSISESTPSHASLDIGQDGRAQIPMSWQNHHPQFIHNFQGHAFQQMPPYLYPGMPVPPAYYPGNVQWPPNGEGSHFDREMDSHKSSYKKKKKKKHSQVLEHSDENGSTASSNSSDESDSDDHSRPSRKSSSTENLHKKKHGKKSSRKVVIRNINYITSNGDGEKGSVTEGSLSNEEEFINGDSLKNQVEEAVVSLERRHKSSSRHHKKQHSAKHPDKLIGSDDADSNGIKGNNNWDAFQNLLLRDDDSTPDTEKQPIKFQEEYIVNKNFEDDSFVVAGRELDSKGRNRVEYFKEGKDAASSIKKKISTDEELLFSRRNEELSGYSDSTVPGLETSLTKCQKEEDWLIVNQSDKPTNEDRYRDFRTFNGVGKNKKDILGDDSFMIQSRSSEDQFHSQSAADISMVSDIVGATELTNSKQEGSHNKTGTLNSHEPDDLFMVLERDSAVERTAAPWTMEMDLENNISSNKENKKLSDIGNDKNSLSNPKGAGTKTPGVRTGKVSSKDAKSKAQNASLGKTKSDIMSRSKVSPGSRTTVTKSKTVKEEETRKRKEELLIQRQKRIAERSAAKKTGSQTKTSAKKENPKIHPSSEDIKKVRKPVLRSSTIDRLATARVSQQKVTPTVAKSGPTKKPPVKASGKGVPLQKTSGTEKKKQGPKEVKTSNHKEDAKKTKGPVLSTTNAKAKTEISVTNGKAKTEMEASVVLPLTSVAVQSVEPNNKNLGVTEKHARYFENVGQLHMDSSEPNHGHALGENQSRGEGVLNKLSSLPGDNKPQHNTEGVINPTPAAIASKTLTVSAVNSVVNQKIDESNAVPPKVSEIQISTPPPRPSNQVMSESIHSRKKWNNDEDSLKAAKGFRKLLFFGRRS